MGYRLLVGFNILLSMVVQQHVVILEFSQEKPSASPLLFHLGDPSKSRKLRGTCSNRQFGLGVQNKAVQRLTEFWKENTWVIASTLFQQHKRRVYTWTPPGGQYQIQLDYICRPRWRSFIQSAKTRLGADCSSDH